MTDRKDAKKIMINACKEVETPQSGGICQSCLIGSLFFFLLLFARMVDHHRLFVGASVSRKCRVNDACDAATDICLPITIQEVI